MRADSNSNNNGNGTNSTLPAAVPMNRAPSNASNTSSSSQTLDHSVWSGYINFERTSLVQEYPQLDRKVLGGFISNVLMRIAQNQDTRSNEQESTGDLYDEWHTALLSELSALHDYYSVGFRIFADFVSRIIRRASNGGQTSDIPYRPQSEPNSRRNSSVFSNPRSVSPPPIANSWMIDGQQRLPPISTLSNAQDGLVTPSASPNPAMHYPSVPLSPPKPTSPSLGPEDYRRYSLTSSVPSISSSYYSRSGTDPYLFSLEPSSKYSARPLPTRPNTATNNTTASLSFATVPQSSLPMKRQAEEYPQQPSRFHKPNPTSAHDSVEFRIVSDKYEENTMAAMMNEANALSAKLGNFATSEDKATTGETPEGRSLACLRCRRKKTRCNHAKPTCSRCAHSGLKCEYPDPLPKPTDMATSIALLQGQLQVLSSRIQAVEKVE